VLSETKERVKSAAATLKTAVNKTREEVTPEGTAQANAIAKHRAAQFADELDDLIRKAEAALAGKPIDSLPEATTTVAPPPPSDVELVIVSEKSDKNVYAAPLPIGFEPPPGFSRPSAPKPAPKAAAPSISPADVPAPVPLPLLAPAVLEVAVSEPVISHLAGTIDNLASYLNSNPAAAEKAKDVLETARNDLTQLASRFDQVREDEQRQLEAKLDEQAREYTTKLLELEIEAQDKLDLQKEDYEKYVEEEKAKFAQVYREKLDHEIKLQTILLNER
jgi:mitofilin